VDTVQKEEIKPVIENKDTLKPLGKSRRSIINKVLNVTEELKNAGVSGTIPATKVLENTAIKADTPVSPDKGNTEITGSGEQMKSEKKQEKEEKIIPVETIFNSIPHDARVSVINQAINLAGTARNYINNTFFSADSKIRRLRRYQIEEHKKYTLSLACLVFFFIGAPLGAIIRKGGLGMPVIVSVLFFILWYIISLVGEKFARESVISPFIGIWLSTFVLIPLGFLLTYKASKDSMILNLEFYSNFINKILNYIKKNWLFIEQ
jgi:lipopolysaccharide export LptBFGC system permease protein LptF